MKHDDRSSGVRTDVNPTPVIVVRAMASGVFVIFTPCDWNSSALGRARCFGEIVG